MPHQLSVADTATVIEDAPTLYCVGTEVSDETLHACTSDSQSLSRVVIQRFLLGGGGREILVPLPSPSLYHTQLRMGLPLHPLQAMK